MPDTYTYDQGSINIRSFSIGLLGFFRTILIWRPAFCGPLDLHSVDFIGLDIESNNYSLTGSLVISNDELSQKIGPKLLFLGFKLPKMETRILWAVYSFHGQLGDEF